MVQTDIKVVAFAKKYQHMVFFSSKLTTFIAAGTTMIKQRYYLITSIQIISIARLKPNNIDSDLKIP